ncbi:MAG: lytic transglycosylase domain-containing protein [Myxococcales bacterium]|nr:lytic transglycosylase domain-containing protein [Polyangiaceae bacterium]MDW8248113.1 lytic transglycosylase domain-containing protein [Myxococcales bacterium]
MLGSLGLGGLSLAGGGCGCGAALVPSTAGPEVPPVFPSSSGIVAIAEAPPALAPSLEPILGDPRLVEAARLADAEDHAGAAAALEHQITALPAGAAELARWRYQAGRQYALARRPLDALRMFAASAAEPWPLASYASFAAAQQALAAGRTEEALVHARAAGGEEPLGGLVDLLLADIHEQRGAVAEAIPLWKRHLASGKNPPRWAEVSLKLARALRTSAPTPSNALEEALALVRRVVLEQPTSPLARPAGELERAILAMLPSERRSALEWRPEEMLSRAMALFEGGKLKEAGATLAEAMAAAQGPGHSGDFACKAATLDGKIKSKRKQREAAVEAWGEAMRHCSGDARAVALYHGGSASASAGNHAEALARYEQIEKDFHGHRLADDARLKGALEALALGDEARFSSMLERIGEDYPEGDMAPEGLFQLALHRMGKGDWAGATTPLMASRKLRQDERDYRSAGRAVYFLARAFQATGAIPQAIELYRRVLQEQPLSFYMALAYARLAELDGAEAASALKAAREAAPPVPPPALDLPQLQAPGALRAAELLRQGELDFARAEIAAARLVGPGASTELQWAVAGLYSKTGALVLAHTIPRGRVSDWLEHYPEGGWRTRWELAYPRPYLGMVEREAKRSGVPVSLVYAVMREESAFDPNAISGAPAYGLMQFTMDTAKSVGKKLGLPISEATVKLPATSIALGCQYLADLRARFPSCPALAIPSYNAGPGATRRWLRQRSSEDLDLFIERIPYEETRNYTKRVIKSYAAYLYLYEPKLLDEALRLPMRTPTLSALGASENE